MTENPLPDYALPHGTTKQLKDLGYNPTLSRNIILRCLNCPSREKNSPAYGLEIVRCTNFKSGLVYPALTSLAQKGLLQSEREEIDPHQAGRPRRILYTLSARFNQALGKTPPLSSCQRRSMA